VVKALRYKPADRGFDSRWCHWSFQWHNPLGRTMVLGSTQPLKEMCTRCIFWGVKAAGAERWQPYHHPVPLSWNLGTLTSWNPLGHSRPVTGHLYLYINNTLNALQSLWSISFTIFSQKQVTLLQDYNSPYHCINRHSAQTKQDFNTYPFVTDICLYVFLALQPIVVLFFTTR
jgi:hypothetical protein